MGGWLFALGVVLWHFPGPGGGALREAVLAAGALPPEHKVTAAAVDEALRAAKGGDELGCLDDTATCDDPAQAGLALVGAAARVDAKAERTASGFHVTLSEVPAGSGEPTTYTGDGKTLAEAAAAAVSALRGTGTLHVDVKPAEASLFLDDHPLGQGVGDYPVAPGDHELRAEAPGYGPAEMPVHIEAKRTDTATIELAKATSQPVLHITPLDAKVTLDGHALDQGPGTYDVTPGAHQLQVSAPKYETYRQDVHVPEGGHLELTVDLGKPAGVLANLPPPNPDTRAHGFYVRAGLRVGSLASGEVGESIGADKTLVTVEDLTKDQTLIGVDLAVGWRGQFFTIEGLGLTFAASGDTVPAKLKELSARARATNLSRVLLRPAWLGARYPIERFEPYAIAGVEVAFESFDLEPVEGAARADGTIDDRSWLLGLELGARYHFTSDWFASVSGAFDFFPGSRGSASLILGGGFALDLPEGL